MILCVVVPYIPGQLEESDSRGVKACSLNDLDHATLCKSKVEQADKWMLLRAFGERLIFKAVTVFGTSLHFTGRAYKASRDIVFMAMETSGEDVELTCEDVRDVRELVRKAAEEKDTKLQDTRPTCNDTYARDTRQTDHTRMLKTMANSRRSLVLAGA